MDKINPVEPTTLGFDFSFLFKGLVLEFDVQNQFFLFNFKDFKDINNLKKYSFNNLDDFNLKNNINNNIKNNLNSTQVKTQTALYQLRLQPRLCTYQNFAEMINPEKPAVRAVATALGKNHLIYFLPCHFILPKHDLQKLQIVLRQHIKDIKGIKNISEISLNNIDINNIINILKNHYKTVAKKIGHYSGGRLLENNNLNLNKENNLNNLNIQHGFLKYLLILHDLAHRILP